MQVRQRLFLNAGLSVIAAAVVLLVFAFAVYRVGKAVEASELAGKIVIGAFERITLRNDYVQSGSERAKAQWFAKHEQIGGLLASAAKQFRDPADDRIVAEMIRDQDSIGRIFTAIVKNREGGRAPAGELALETEARLLSQLNMRIYELVLQARGLQESSREALFSALRLAGWGIAGVLLLAIAAVIGNSWTMGRSLTERIRRLRDGAVRIGEGELNRRIDVQGADEIAELSGAFNAMAAKLKSSYRDLENEVEQRKRVEEAIRELNDDLTVKNELLGSANRELESFIYSVSHDLRQPLRAIASYSQIVGKGLQGGLADREKGYLSRIAENAEKMSGLIEDMLKLSRVSRQEIKRERIDLARMAGLVVSGIREAHPERCTEIAIGAGLFAVADEGLMAAVLENLIGNAWKFTIGKEQARIEFGAVQQEGLTVFFVRDNGAGFDPAYAESLFKPFHRLHAESEFDGTGIGLSIVERIIGRHGGRVWAEGGIGQGAAFYFTLPPPPPPYPSSKAA